MLTLMIEQYKEIVEKQNEMIAKLLNQCAEQENMINELMKDCLE